MIRPTRWLYNYISKLPIADDVASYLPQISSDLKNDETTMKKALLERGKKDWTHGGLNPGPHTTVIGRLEPIMQSMRATTALCAHVTSTNIDSPNHCDEYDVGGMATCHILP